MELKLDRQGGLFDKASWFNRTFMELKRHRDGEEWSRFGWFNRTFMELKQEKTKYVFTYSSV